MSSSALFVDLLEKIEKVVRHRFLSDIVIHPAQLAPDGTLAGPDRPRLFVRLFFVHGRIPLLRHVD